MAIVVEVYYGSSQITPAPIISDISRQFTRDESGNLIGYRYTITIEGHIFEQNNPGIANTVNNLEALNNIFDCDNKTFQVVCDGTVILSFCPIIQSITYTTQAGDNMVQHIPYTVVMETPAVFDFNDGCAYDSCLKTVIDTWDIQPYADCSVYTLGSERPPYLFSVSHTVSATAFDCTNACDYETTGNDTPSTVIKGVIVAKNWVETRLDEEYVSGILFNIDSCFANKSRRNYNRVVRSSETEGSYELTETWLLAASGSAFTFDAIDDFTIEISEQRESPFTSVTVNGTIQGLEVVDYSGCYDVTASKYENASAYYDSIKASTIKARAELVSGLTLNSITSSKVYSHSPKNGVITYTYTYDDSPEFCLTGVTNIYSESFSVETVYPVDVLSKVNVLGRTCPLLQCLGLKTENIKNINIDIVTDPAEGCPTGVAYFEFAGDEEIENIIYTIYADLVANYGSVYTSNSSRTWNPRTGAYSRSVSFTYVDCC